MAYITTEVFRRTIASWKLSYSLLDQTQLKATALPLPITLPRNTTEFKNMLPHTVDTYVWERKESQGRLICKDILNC